MRAVFYEQFGPAEDVLTFGDMETPTPSPGEVLVRLTHSGVNPSDAKSRAGTRPGVTKPDFPRIIPHSDGAGTIFAVGGGVDPARMDQHVWLWNAQWQRAHGTAAEMIALPADQAVPLPEGVAHEVGATLGIPGLTACHTVFGGGEVAGQTLLISGGAGAVGHMAVQLAKWGGATVITTASANAADFVGDTGADHVLDYRDPELADQIRDIAPAGIDRAVEVEFGSNAPLLAEVMKPVGTIAAYGSAKAMTPELPFGAFLFKALKIDISLIYILPAPERTAAIARLHAALTEGALKPAIHASLPLSECVTAHNMVLSPGRRGAVLLETV